MTLCYQSERLAHPVPTNDESMKAQILHTMVLAEANFWIASSHNGPTVARIKEPVLKSFDRHLADLRSVVTNWVRPVRTPAFLAWTVIQLTQSICLVLIAEAQVWFRIIEAGLEVPHGSNKSLDALACHDHGVKLHVANHTWIK
jgi:hypothetical protein